MAVALYTIHIIVAVLLILVILLQQGKGSDLGAAFGGASSTVFGGASGRQSFLVKVTIVLGVIFVLMSLGLSFRASQIQKKGPIAPPAPVEENAPIVPSPVAPSPGAASRSLPSAPSPTEPAPSLPGPEAPTAPAPGPETPGNK